MAAPATVRLFNSPTTILSDQEKGYRVFTVEQENFVLLPGCLSVEDIKLDGVTIPQYIEEEVLSDLTDKRFHTLRIALWDVVQNEQGPALVRSLKSNNGKWQIGSRISVLGKWADAPATKGK